jgi:hypothetical protein
MLPPILTHLKALRQPTRETIRASRCQDWFLAFLPDFFRSWFLASLPAPVAFASGGPAVRPLTRCMVASSSKGRFRAFTIGEDDHLRIVLRCIERNPLRASLVERADQWPWSSLCPDGKKPPLDAGPAPRGAGWVKTVNAPMTEAEGEAIRTSIHRNRPLGTESWVRAMAETLGLPSSLRAPGRPRTTMEPKER